MAGTDMSVGVRKVGDNLGKESEDLEWQTKKLELYFLCGRGHCHRYLGEWSNLICILRSPLSY